MAEPRTLTIVNVAYPLAPVSQDAVGGAEQIVSALDAAITRAGHRSIVIACAGSRVQGELLPIPAASPPFDAAAIAAAQASVRAALARCAPSATIVHLHGIDFSAYLPPPGPPVLVTLHLPPDWYAPGAFRHARPGTWHNCVSATQDRAARHIPTRLPPIANGVDVAALGAVRHGRRNYALTLGRICPEKRQHLAAQAASLAGTALLIGGQIHPYPAHRFYFETELRPLLGPACRFLGPLAFTRKRRLLAGARCLLAPSAAAETSSLVAMEALACGTPVIATPNGALPDLIEHGRTGFLVSSAADMAHAIAAAPGLDPELCRATARQRFSRLRMTDEYLATYRRLA